MLSMSGSDAAVGPVVLRVHAATTKAETHGALLRAASLAQQRHAKMRVRDAVPEVPLFVVRPV